MKTDQFVESDSKASLIPYGYLIKSDIISEVAIASGWTIFLGIPLYVVFLLLIYYELYLHGAQVDFSLFHMLGKVIPIHLATLLLWLSVFWAATFAIHKALIQKRRLEKAQEHIHASQTQALTDSLTGVWNRRGFDLLLQTGLEHCRDQEIAYTLLLIDLDNFKAYNDTNGHLAGDRLLEQVAQHLIGSIRRQDTVARYGGDEFAVLCPGLGWTDAVDIARRIRGEESHLPLGLSVGPAVFPLDGDSPNSLIQAADKRLYQAKHHKQQDFNYGEIP